MTVPRLSAADLVVLALLKEGPRHGYGIVSELDARDAEDWAPISKPQVYYSLKKLDAAGLVHLKNDGDKPLGPERELFKITARGSLALTASLLQRRWAEQRPPPPFLTWMALSSYLTAAGTPAMIEARRRFLQKECAREKTTLKTFAGLTDPMVVPGKLMVAFTIQQMESELKWLDRVAVELPAVRNKTNAQTNPRARV